MKTTFAVVLALLTSTFTLNAQCGRCGPDGGPPPALAFANTGVFRSVRQTNLLPDASGSFTVTLRSHYTGLSYSSANVSGSTEVVLDYSIAAPLIVTSLEVRQRNSAGTDSVIALGPTVANPLSIPAGQGTLSLQGPAQVLDNSVGTTYTVFARTVDRPEGFSLGALLPAQEVTRLASIPANIDLAGGALAVTATIARDASRAITSAEIRYDLRLRANASAAALFTSLELRGGGASSSVLLRPSAPVTGVPAGGEALVRFRQPVDVGDTGSIAALEALAGDPGFLTAVIRSGSGGANSVAATLSAAQYASFLVTSTRIAGTSEPAGITAVGLTNFWLLRSAKGDPLAAFAQIDWSYSGFAAGSTFRSLTLASDPAPTLVFDSARNSLTVNSTGSGSVYQSTLLLPGDSLLTAILSPQSFKANLNTALSPAGALLVQFFLNYVPLFPTGPTIQSLLPATTTPGSIVSIFGLSLPDNPLVSIAGSSAEVLYSSPSQINIRVPRATSIGYASLYVVGRFAASNSADVFIDGAQPFIFSDDKGPIVYLADGVTRISAANPAKPGDRIRIFCTGTPADITTGWTYGVDLAGRSYAANPLPLPGVAGVWSVDLAIDPATPSGPQPLRVTATSQNRRTFSENTVQLPIK